jgi:hypothetical protein
MMKIVWGSALVVLVLLLVSHTAIAQISDKVSKVTAASVQEGQPLSIQVDLLNPALIKNAEVAYRHFGEQTYKRMELSIVGNAATGTISSGEVSPPFLEFYIILTLGGNGQTETYPVENAEVHPLRADVQERVLPAGYIAVVSPEEREVVRREDVLISFTVKSDSLLDSSATRVFIDGTDVSSFAVTSGSLVVLRPENTALALYAGNHTVRAEAYSRDHTLLESSQWAFTISGAAEQPMTRHEGGWIAGGTLQLETRNEKIDTLPGVPYNRATLTANAANGIFRTQGKLYLTNEEHDDRQPQHRFSLTAEIPWLKLGVGDMFPTYPDLIMNGRRVRGFFGDLMLGSFDLSVTSGQTVRQIEGDTIKTFPADSLTAELQRDSTATYRLYDAASVPPRWAKYRSGTFSRSLLVIRPRFGTEDNHWGFTFLKSTDDKNSIQFGSKPQENLVVGSDFLASIGSHTVDFTGQAAVSATNKDITRGTFTNADIDSLYKAPDYSDNDRSNIRRVRDILSRFMTVNENLIPLGANNMPTLAYEGGIAINAFDNALRGTYMRHGNSFESFGQSFVRPDVKGYNVSDNLRLLRNTILLSGGYERMKDNTAETKIATTTSTTGNIGVSYLSRSDVPSVTVAYLLAENISDYPVDSLATNDRTNRVVVQLSKPFVYAGRHQAALSVSTSHREDKSTRRLNSDNTTVSLGMTSAFAIPLQTVFNLLVSANTLPSVDSTGKPVSFKRNYTSLYLNGQYRLVEDRLLLTATVSPTFGDIGRTLLDGGVRYFFTKSVSAQTQVSLYLNNDRANDLIGSLILRMEL